jgi:dTDP-4-dehydrorhamnose 3,5-epimerase
VIFEELAVAGAFLVKPERRSDDRGYFARMWCRQELGSRGLVNHIEQINTGFSPKAGTLRGMHYQLPPHAEVKIARCTRGAVFDVVVDLRQGSPSLGRWAGVHLTPEAGALLYVPQGCAHGYLTLRDDTELVYMTSAPYAPGAARGVRHDDAAFGIDWPAAVHVISEPDRNWPAFGPADAVVVPEASA